MLTESGIFEKKDDQIVEIFSSVDEPSEILFKEISFCDPIDYLFEESNNKET